jgi:hypothetical protein
MHTEGKAAPDFGDQSNNTAGLGVASWLWFALAVIVLLAAIEAFR